MTDDDIQYFPLPIDDWKEAIFTIGLLLFMIALIILAILFG